MTYSALSIDTNVLYKHGFDFEHGLVGQLARLAKSSATLVLTDVVRREFLKHVREQTDKTYETLATTTTKALRQGVLPSQAEETARSLIGQLVDPATAAQARVDQFLAMTAAVVAEDALASISDVMRLYFDDRPPFETSGAKKAEFPDAVALLTLEAWARNHGKVLVVSKDRGWSRFAETSEFIDVVNNLGLALATIQEQDQAKLSARASIAVSSLVAGIASGTLPRLAQRFGELLEIALESLDLYPEASSENQVEGELTELLVDDREIVERPSGGYDVNLVRIEPDTAIFTVPISAELTVTASFTFYRWRFTEGYVKRGSQHSMKAMTVDDEVLVTVRGDLTAPDTLEIESVELINPPSEVDFGEVELEMDDDERRMLTIYSITD